jgi:hypothetical protein
MTANGMRPTEFKLIRDWIDLQVEGKEFRSADVARDIGLVPRKIGHILKWQPDIVKHSRDRVGRIYKKVSL